MYNLLEYSKNYRKTTSFRNYYRDEPNIPPLNDDDPPTINYNGGPILSLLNTKVVLQEKYQIKSRKRWKHRLRRLRKILKLLFH